MERKLSLPVHQISVLCLFSRREAEKSKMKKFCWPSQRKKSYHYSLTWEINEELKRWENISNFTLCHFIITRIITWKTVKQLSHTSYPQVKIFFLPSSLQVYFQKPKDSKNSKLPIIFQKLHPLPPSNYIQEHTFLGSKQEKLFRYNLPTGNNSAVKVHCKWLPWLGF